MTVFTIGFTKKSAEQFFAILKHAGVRSLVDTRLNNRSQLAGFAKADDLRFFLKELGGIEYRHVLEMAPTQQLLDSYRKEKNGWEAYEKAFNDLLEKRELAAHYRSGDFANACLLCSEHEPERCHRRLVAEYLQRHFPNLHIEHLK